ncbi:hypothetical protein LOC69_23910 [Blastopirellula sp. JC733]|nr:hypothetical protein [Blastopirellula sediminis]
MRHLAVILTITAMLWHAIVGCCAHHVHAEDACCQSTSGKSAVADDHHGGCGHHHAVAEPDEVANQTPASEESDPHSHCSELRCVYVTTGSDEMPSADDCWSQPCYLETSCAISLVADCSLLEARQREDLSPDGPAMRRHLLMGVLRI